MSRLNKIFCFYHPEADLIDDYHTGDSICTTCGIVITERNVDESPEWNDFDNAFGEKTGLKSRVGAADNNLFNGNNLTTRIGRGTAAFTPKFHGSSSTSSSSSSKYKPLKQPESRKRELEESSDEEIEKHQEKRPKHEYPGSPPKKKPAPEPRLASDAILRLAYDQIDELASRLNITEGTAKRGKFIYKSVEDGGHCRGRPRGAKVAACVYIACRQEGCPRSFKEITRVSTSDKKHIGRAFTEIVNLLKVEVERSTTGNFLERFCGNLDLPNSVPRVARKICKSAVEKHIVSGKSYISVAAAAIYIAAKELGYHKTLESIGESCGVAEATIRQSRNAILEYRDLVMPDNLEEEKRKAFADIERRQKLQNPEAI